MPHPSEDTAGAFARFARDLLEQDTVDATLDEITALAVSEIEGCEYAGVSLLYQGGELTTPSSTDPIVEEADRLQHTTGQGPGIEAISARTVCVVSDLARETRWPAFTEGATRLGLAGMMSLQLFTHQRVLGSLNLYSTETGAFDQDSTEVGEILAAHAAVALAAAQKSADLHQAIRTRERIGEATGILMERYRLTNTQAFSLLVKASQKLNTKLRDIAEDIVRTGDFPSGAA
ncbi:GAF and ANTAR domain-containing protein [Nocardiopsis sp. MG754419]|uniref:GAF and ANTAR domain-containing protein n=1 Tax=Nocardiopsis sp. MG754419 TaxID=2259865 RepID=UPI001BA9F0BA|nr:GAF and ANTAR domain-containing protein [Nocardiopsis sp. MG754419]MBR8743758.1 antitermination regulator [Nocardiopsis sp. MG754419]